MPLQLGQLCRRLTPIVTVLEQGENLLGTDSKHWASDFNGAEACEKATLGTGRANLERSGKILLLVRPAALQSGL